jgi:hypothetical protein
MPRFLNAGVGIAGINSTAVCNSFNHMNSGTPYSAIYVYILFKIYDFMRKRAGILVIAI